VATRDNLKPCTDFTCSSHEQGRSLPHVQLHTKQWISQSCITLSYLSALLALKQNKYHMSPWCCQYSTFSLVAMDTAIELLRSCSAQADVIALVQIQHRLDQCCQYKPPARVPGMHFPSIVANVASASCKRSRMNRFSLHLSA
jgi:hypothetical protein